MSDDIHPMSVADARREIANLRDLLEQKIKALGCVISTRLDAMDRALELASARSGPVLQEINTRLAERWSFYELDRAEILRRIVEIERMVGEWEKK